MNDDFWEFFFSYGFLFLLSFLIIASLFAYAFVQDSRDFVRLDEACKEVYGPDSTACASGSEPHCVVFSRREYAGNYTVEEERCERLPELNESQGEQR